MTRTSSLLFSMIFAQALPIFAQLCPPNILWQKERAEFVSDSLYFYAARSDGGFLLGGSSYRGPGPDKTSPNYGSSDFYLVGLDANLEKIWDRSYGGTNSDWLAVARETTDGGFILGGYSYSGASGNKSSTNFGSSDYWVVRTDADGNVLWDRSFGGSGFEQLVDVRQTADGGFVIAGYSNSGTNGNKTSPNYGFYDYWVVRTDADGNKLWDRSLGGSDNDIATSIQETSDGGFIIGGTSYSPLDGTKIEVNYGSSDYWVIRLDANGQEMWQHVFGGGLDDELVQVRQGADGGFILVGSSTSGGPSGNRTSPGGRGYPDIWVVALDANGSEIWQQSVGGGESSQPKDVITTPDGGWLVGGISWSAGGNKTGPSFGSSDYWLIRFSGAGDILWDWGYGGKSYDTLYAVDRTTDGGVILMGETTSRAGGNKTTQFIGPVDIWVLKLGLETPGDCDGDGIPDGQDFCNGTPQGSLVNSNGCSIDQLCPCDLTRDDGTWTNHEQYVQCVGLAAAGFLQAGLITEEQRSNIVAGAAAANCPFIPTPIVAFGLTNVALHQAYVVFDSEQGGLFATDLGEEGKDGISMRLGEADSGLFIYPDAPVAYNYNDAWFMRATAYGSLNGVTNRPLSTMTAKKTYYETYPVEVDFSMLGATSITYQVFLQNALVTQVTEPGPVGRIVVNSGYYLGPRGNPFWRAPDGSLGAVIDLDVTDSTYVSITGPFYEARGDHIFIRANDPTNTVQFVSKVDIVEGGGLPNFTVLNARLGMFHRGHQALGSAVFAAAGGKLTVDTGTNAPNPGYEQDVSYSGTLIEARAAARFDVTLEPIKLTTNGASVEFYAAGEDYVFGTAGITNVEGTLHLVADFLGLYVIEGTNLSPQIVALKVYNNGSLAGSLTNPAGTFTLNGSASPGLVAWGAASGSSNSSPYLAFTLDEHVTFSDGGEPIQGNQFRLVPVEPNTQPTNVSLLTMAVRSFPSFTIIDEQPDSSPPALSIVITSEGVVLSWPVDNRPFILESTPSLDEEFSAVGANVFFVNGRSTVTVSLESTGNKFFRLTSSEN